MEGCCSRLRGRPSAAVFALAWAARAVACNSTLSERGVNYAITALALGLFVSNVLGVPGWLRAAMRTEYYIKTGLVILGTNVCSARSWRPACTAWCRRPR